MIGKKVKFRITFLSLVIISLSLIVFLILKSLEENVVYFKSPTEIKNLPEITKNKIRIGGMVKKNSLKIEADEIIFTITDFKNDINVTYSGILPNLFEEETGVVAEGFIPVTLKVVDENNLNISSTNKDIGGGVEEIDIKILGLEVGDVTDFQISFNPNYLIQGIEVLDGNKAFLRFSGNDKPAVIQGEEETYQYLLMPVRTNE